MKLLIILQQNFLVLKYTDFKPEKNLNLNLTIANADADAAIVKTTKTKNNLILLTKNAV